MNYSFVAENAKERERLIKLVNTITDEQLMLTLYEEGWTVAVALAHLAFWDERRRVLLRQWKKHDVKQSPVDADVINNAMLALLKAIPPRAAANLAVSAAAAIDEELKDVSPDIVAGIKAIGDAHAFERFVHRKMHLDDIQTLLEAQGLYIFRGGHYHRSAKTSQPWHDR